MLSEVIDPVSLLFLCILINLVFVEYYKEFKKKAIHSFVLVSLISLFISLIIISLFCELAFYGGVAMPTEKEIIEQFKSPPNGESYIGVAGIKELARIMDDGEAIHAVVDGYYGPDEECGLFLATEKRLIYIHKGILWGVHVEIFDYKNIISLQYSSDPYCGRVRIDMNGHYSFLKTVPGENEAGFVETVRRYMKSAEGRRGGASTDILSQLERLATLHASGALSDEEFTAAKRKILDMD